MASSSAKGCRRHFLLRRFSAESPDRFKWLSRLPGSRCESGRVSMRLECSAFFVLLAMRCLFATSAPPSLPSGNGIAVRGQRAVSVAPSLLGTDPQIHSCPLWCQRRWSRSPHCVGGNAGPALPHRVGLTDYGKVPIHNSKQHETYRTTPSNFTASQPSAKASSRSQASIASKPNRG